MSLAWVGQLFAYNLLVRFDKDVPPPRENEENFSWATCTSYVGPPASNNSENENYSWTTWTSELGPGVSLMSGGHLKLKYWTCFVSFMLLLKPMIGSPCHQDKLFMIIQSVLLCSSGTITELIDQTRSIQNIISHLKRAKNPDFHKG